MEKRTQKQLIIGGIFLLIVVGIGYGFVDYFFVVEPTCFDKIRNGKEESVDCGTLACGVVCEPEILPINTIQEKLIEIAQGDYDFIAQINNPNSVFGSSIVRYELTLHKQDGTSAIRTGNFYILPGQTRYLIVPGIKSDSVLSNPQLTVSEIQWEKVQSFENPNFQIQRKNYVVSEKNGVFSELEGIIFNTSDFNFDKVEVGVILFDEGNQIIGVNMTDIRTFVSRSERYFKVSWPAALPESFRQEVEILTNVFENSNFIRRYGTPEKFQKYY